MTTEKFVVALAKCCIGLCGAGMLLATGGILESKKREDLEKRVKILEEHMNAKEDAE